ncbi:ligand-gated channel [Stenotrophomonas panacihumi]|uniref:Ligand-gated channel n=1 Tax=Stenotrophomonas panacihumi TaxID=676599 RepID=A0A0R0AX19_9GAMM|nr:ligand-gated channel [Stenotrophomonas panacihumi]
MGASESTVVELERVQVQGRARTLYRADDAAVATRSDTPLPLVPQSVQVLPRQLIDDQAARQVTDLYRNIAGLSQFNYASVMLRGFRQENVLYDGLRGDPYGGLTVPQLFTIERVEVLKGPSGAVFGSGDPGGVINYVTRKPLHTTARTLRLQLGNEDFGAASFEATGPWQRLPALRYRAALYADGQAGPRWNANSGNRIADLGLALSVAEHGELSLQYTALAQDLGGNRLRGVPVDDDGRFLADPRWNQNEADDFQRLRSEVTLARFTLSPTPAWDLDAAIRWTTSRDEQIYHEPRGLIDRNGDGVANWMTRELRHQHRSNDTLATAFNALWRVATGTVEHKLGAGVDYLRGRQSFHGQTARTDSDRRRPGPVPGIALHDPRYRLTSFRDYGLARLPWTREPASSLRKGIYLQDELTTPSRWYLLAGLRWDSFEDIDGNTGQRSSGSDLSWRLGATWRANAHLNVYANLASGFMPQAAASQRAAVGGPFDPQRSRQWEAGLKASPFGERLSLNAALYRIERSNILQATGQSIDGIDQMRPLGLVRSQGAELELLADLGERWALSLAYAYNDARVLRAGQDGITDGVGERFANAPRNTFGSWIRYDIPAWSSALGLGAEYMGERVSLQGQRIRPYTLFDASWQTQAAGWQWQLSLKNLFNRVYAASGHTRRNGHFPGEPRRIYLQATYAF